MITRWRCTDCGTITPDAAILSKPNPFNHDYGDVFGCPVCFSVEKFEPMCDVDDCTEIAGCGWVSPVGYRNTCSKHMGTER